MNDTRSYNDEAFVKALRILNNPKKAVRLDAEGYAKFEKLVDRLKTLK